ncbi:MAG: iron ABC transporter permease [Desulfurococcus sp.]|nr:iron ABC transporter permease [Desulfurococcus sp.]
MKSTSFFLLATLLILLVLLLYDLNGVSPLVFNYRLNRILSALFTGAIIALAGVLLQSSLRNPLVDHYLLGVGSGALTATYLSVIAFNGYFLGVQVFSMMGGLAALALTILLAEKLAGTSSSYILAGIGVNSLLSGASVLLSYIAVRVYPYAQLLLVGSFITSTPEKLQVLAGTLVFSTVLFTLIAKPLNTLSVSDEFAVTAGFNPRITRLTSIIVAGLSSSIVTSMYGLIGFIGLASPHMARYITGRSDNRVVGPVAILLSSTLLYLTDFTSRRVFTAVWGEVPAGAVASLIGAPYFIYLLVFKRGALR